MLRAKKFLRCVGVGVTSPCLLEGDDDCVYVVKFKNNRLGAKVLVNEFIASRLGEAAGLCFPPGAVMELTEDFLRRTPPLRRARVAPGLHFASRYIRGAKYVRHRHVARIINPTELAGVMLFDHLLHNEDRTLNGKNLLIRREAEGYRCYAIDHSHLFGSGRWRVERLAALADRVALNERRAYGTLLRHYLKAEDFAPYVGRFAALTEDELAAIVAAVPEEWLRDAAARQALREFLVRRCARAAALAELLVARIPPRETALSVTKSHRLHKI